MTPLQELIWIHRMDKDDGTFGGPDSFYAGMVHASVLAAEYEKNTPKPAVEVGEPKFCPTDESCVKVYARFTSLVPGVGASLDFCCDTHRLPWGDSEIAQAYRRVKSTEVKPVAQSESQSELPFCTSCHRPGHYYYECLAYGENEEVKKILSDAGFGTSQVNRFLVKLKEAGYEVGKVSSARSIFRCRYYQDCDEEPKTCGYCPTHCLCGIVNETTGKTYDEFDTNPVAYLDTELQQAKRAVYTALELHKSAGTICSTCRDIWPCRTYNILVGQKS